MNKTSIMVLKTEKLYDLICRACANGTGKEVAAAIAVDWCPTIEVDGSGGMTVILTPNAELSGVAKRSRLLEFLVIRLTRRRRIDHAEFSQKACSD